MTFGYDRRVRAIYLILCVLSAAALAGCDVVGTSSGSTTTAAGAAAAGYIAKYAWRPAEDFVVIDVYMPSRPSSSAPRCQGRKSWVEGSRVAPDQLGPTIRD